MIFHRWEQESVANIMLPVTLCSMTGLLVGQWWSGEAYPWRGTQLCVSDKILGPTGSWFPPSTTSCGESKEAVPGGWKVWYQSLTPYTWAKSCGTPRLDSSNAARSHLSCPAAPWCPGPDLGGEPPGHHPSSHYGHVYKPCWGHTN